MKTFEIVIASVNRQLDELIESMNLCSNSIISNQCERYAMEEKMVDENHYLMIHSRDRGVGKNRNIALSFSNADILLFADEDMVYYDEYEKKVLEAFHQLPDADVIFFQVNSNKFGNASIHNRIRRMHMFTAMSYGTYKIAVRRNSIKKHGISFHECFGGGCIYGSGEDSLFIWECLHKKLKIYEHPVIIGCTDDFNSTWFSGFNEKYFYDKGAFLKCIPFFYRYVFLIYYCIRFQGKTSISVKNRLKYMMLGMKFFPKLISYFDYKRGNEGSNKKSV